MPLLSIIVPVHGVQGYLRECLDSVLGQSFTDLEVVAIDDASPDHSGEILDLYAEREPRLRVLHLPSNVGLGRARNIGLAEAVGEYVWFVDSDDWIAPGSLRRIAAALTTHRPDVLLLDYTRVSWLGEHRPSTAEPLLAQVEAAGAVSLGDVPQLLTLFTVAWNKVVRREFLHSGVFGSGESGVFPDGWYEDLPFTFPVLVAAQRIAAVNRVCYHYRRRRGATPPRRLTARHGAPGTPGDAITQTRSPRHAEVFDQWSTVFTRLDRIGARAQPFRAAIFDRMVWHLLVVQSRHDRLPARSRRAFFHQMSLFYRRYAVPGATPPGRLDRLRHRMVAADAYTPVRFLRATRAGLLATRRLARSTGGVTRTALRRGGAGLHTALGRAYYGAQRLLPVDQRLAVYAAYWYRGVSCNPAAIYASAADLAPAVRGVWIVDRPHKTDVPAGTPYLVAGSLASYRALARARWLVNNVNFPDFVVKRPGTTHVQTHHGTPVKVMGLEQSGYPIGAHGLDMAALMRRCDRWDISLSSNAHSSEVWSRAYPARYSTVEYGYPRNDRLAMAEPDEIAAAREAVGAAGRRVVLYAPTHREYLGAEPALLDPEELADALGPQTLLLVRAHYFYDNRPTVPGAVSGWAHPGVRDVSTYPCIEDLLLATDLLITDYSSVMFDYAVLDRPIVVFAPDWDTYRRTRGVTFDLLAEAPGAVATTMADLVDVVRTGEATSEAATKARAQFRERFCYLDDGRAADRVVRHVFADVLARPV